MKTFLWVDQSRGGNHLSQKHQANMPELATTSGAYSLRQLTNSQQPLAMVMKGDEKDTAQIYTYFGDNEFERLGKRMEKFYKNQIVWDNMVVLERLNKELDKLLEEE